MATTLGWRASFAALAALAVILVAWVRWKVPNVPATRPPAASRCAASPHAPGIPTVLAVTMLLGLWGAEILIHQAATS
jgi:predicted MFS family arabinose efflux permease